MDTLAHPVVKQSTIEGFPLSPAQSHALNEYGEGRAFASQVVLSWSAAADFKKIVEFLKSRVSTQPMFSTRIYPIDGESGGLQVLNAGEARHLAVSDSDTFEKALIAPFAIEESEVLRCIYQVHDDQLQRLAIVSPPYICDVDGLLRLIAVQPYEGDLTFQHFSEWCAETAPDVEPALHNPTPLDLGISSTRRSSPLSARLTGVCASGNEIDPHEAASVGAAVLLPYFRAVDDDKAVCSLSFDGRLFDDFALVAGPFRLTAPLCIARKAESARSFADHMRREVDETLHRHTFTMAPVRAQFACLLSVVEVPERAELFRAANVEVGATAVAELELRIQIERTQVVVSAVTMLADCDEALLTDLAGRALAVLTRDVRSTPANVAELGGLKQPVHPVVQLGRGSINEVFAATVAEMPHAPAFVTAQRTHTFAELDAAAGCLAAALAARFAPKNRILIFADRSFDAAVAMFGVLRAGMTCVPILRDFPDERIRHIADVATATGAVAEPAEFARAASVLRIPVLPALGHDLPVHCAAADGQDEAYILFTSGSTGEPKGVVVAQHSVLNLLEALRERVYAGHERDLRLSVNAPLAFDSSMKQFFQAALGRTLVPIPAEVRADPEALIVFAAAQRLFALDVTPTILKAMIAAGFGRHPERMPRMVLVGGEAIDQVLWDEVRKWTTCEVWNVYGPTEATVNTLVTRVKDAEHPTLGHPLRGVSVACIDAQGYELPLGATGELQISGAGVAIGYIGASQSENANFSVAANGARCYSSGDFVRRLPSGGYNFLGRRDEQVKVSGQRLELGEIEACLKRQPGVRNAAVMIDKSVEGDPRIVAGVVADRPVDFAPEPGELLVEVPSGHRVSSVNMNETIYQYKEIFEDKIYIDEKIVYPEDAVILDVGANIGMFSLFVASALPKAKIYAFEPLAPIRERLQRNVRRYAPGVSILPYGLSDVERQEAFTYYPGYSMMSGQQAYADAPGEKAVIASYLSKAAEGGNASAQLLADNLDEVLDGRFDAHPHDCRLRRLSDMLDEHGIQRIDMLKIDVQRAELDVLRGIEPRHFAIIRAISMELHDDPHGKTGGRRREITVLLERVGFVVRTMQDPLLAGTDRWNLVACRPEAATPTGVVSFASLLHMGGEVTPAALSSALRVELPAFMVPREIRLLEDLPRTPQGKLDKRELLRLIDAPAAPPAAAAMATPAVPRQDVQSVLLSIWREVLRKPDLDLGDDFFANGGDSIRAILMQSKARAAGISVGLKELHATPTIAGLRPMAVPTALAVDQTAVPEPAAAVPARHAATSAADALLAIWREVLRKPDLRSTDDFFSSGGDSIRAILMQSRARAVGISVSLKDLHATPTVAGLMVKPHPLLPTIPASVASQAIGSVATRAEPCRWLATSMQRLMLLASLTRDDALVFHNATITPVHLPYDAETFRRALTETRMAHPILTARVEVTGDALYFVFDPGRADGSHPYEDLRALSAAAQEVRVTERVFAERSAPFDPERGTLVRFGVLERAPSFFEILVAEHHAALDGYSLNAIVRELVERYCGTAVETTDDVVVFDAVTGNEQAADASAVTTAFWGERFAGVAEIDHFAMPRSIGQRSEMRQVKVLESAELFPVLHAFARRVGFSTKAVLFSLHVQALTAAFGHKPSQLGVVYSLRPEVEGSLAAIGNFLNVLPVPTAKIDGLLEETRSFDRFDRDVFAHKYVSHDRLSESLGARADIHCVYNFIQFAEPDRAKGDKHETERRFFAVDAMMPLSVDWDLSADRLNLGFQYDAQRVEWALVSRLQSSLAQVVTEFLAAESVSGLGISSRPAEIVLSAFATALQHRPNEQDVLADIGLHSLQMVRIARRLMDAFGTKFPLTEFIPLRTVGDVVRYCEALNRPFEISFVELTPPLAGVPKARLIGFQQVGVAASIFDPWCDLVPQGVSIHALRYPDFSSMGDLSSVPFEQFVDGLVRALAPLANAPMVFVGSCFGAVLAYETACHPTCRPLGVVFIGSGAPSGEGPAPTYHLMTDVQLKAELVRMKSMPDRFLEDDENLAPVFLALRGMSQLATSYQSELQALPNCALTCVWPRADVTVSKLDMVAWSALTSGRFVLTEIDGSHAVLMDDPLGVYEASGIHDLLLKLTSNI